MNESYEKRFKNFWFLASSISSYVFIRITYLAHRVCSTNCNLIIFDEIDKVIGVRWLAFLYYNKRDFYQKSQTTTLTLFLIGCSLGLIYNFP